MQTGDGGAVDAAAQARIRADVLSVLPLAKLDNWQTRTTQLARDILERLQVNRPVELIGEYVRPWCDAVAPIAMEEYLKPLSKGLSETLPAFLANALLDLIHNPHEWARLRAQNELMPKGCGGAAQARGAGSHAGAHRDR